MRPTTVSLFCGAGGESLGKEMAFRELGLDVRDMLAYACNHWGLAVATHALNMPWVGVRQEDLTKVSAADFGLAGERVQLLWASPSCVHFSRARGAKPTDATNNTRSHAWAVLERWLRLAHVDVFLMENVAEFVTWERYGEFLAALAALGYTVETRILCAADYGDPTTRKRFFLQAARDGRGIHWPEPTHANPKRKGGLCGLLPWRSAAECIDWSDLGTSIFERKRPLAPATMRRIAAGLVKFVLNGKPFIVNTAYGGTTGRASYEYDPEEPLRTVTASAGFGVVSGVAAPFVAKLSHGTEHGAGVQSPDEPLRTQTGQQDKAVIAPILVNYRGTDARRLDLSAARVDDPMKTVTGGIHEALVTPFLASLRGTAPDQIPNTVASAEDPVRTVAAGGNHAALIAPFLAAVGYGERAGQAPRVQDPHSPLGTVVAGGVKAALVAPFLSAYHGPRHGGDEARGVDLHDPVSTLDTSNRFGLIAPILATIDQQSTGESAVRSPADPLSTATTKARHAVVAATLMANNSNNAPHEPAEPLGTVTTGDRHYVVASFLEKGFGGPNGHQTPGAPIDAPMPVVTTHDHSNLVAAFLTEYYSNGVQSQGADDPLHTVTTLARHGLVTVEIDGQTYVITDIRMRMLEPRELARAMGFPDWYQWTGLLGKPLTKRDQVKMIGNAVSVRQARALVRAVVMARPEVFGLPVPPAPAETAFTLGVA